jgi:hypothetical protein
VPGALMTDLRSNNVAKGTFMTPLRATLDGMNVGCLSMIYGGGLWVVGF